MSWSYSTLKDYEACPHRLALKRANAPVTQQKTQMAGIGTHEAIETFIKGTSTTLPTTSFEADIRLLRAKYSQQLAHSELKLGITRNWTPTDWPKAHGRAVIDAMLFRPDHLVAYDFKTGKIRPEHEDQANAYAPFLFAHYPDHEIVSFEFLYLDHNHRTLYHYTRARAEERIKPHLQTRIDRMENDFLLNPNPQKHRCAYCKYLNACEFAPDEAFEIAPK